MFIIGSEGWSRRLRRFLANIMKFFLLGLVGIWILLFSPVFGLANSERHGFEFTSSPVYQVMAKSKVVHLPVEVFGVDVHAIKCDGLSIDIVRWACDPGIKPTVFVCLGSVGLMLE